MYNVQCEMYNLKYEISNLQCEMFNVQCEMYNILCTSLVIRGTLHICNCIKYIILELYTRNCGI